MKKRKRILAWIGIVFLVGLYVATFVFAMIDSSAAFDMFKVCLGFTVVIPVLLYAYNMVGNALRPDGKPEETDRSDSKTKETSRPADKVKEPSRPGGKTDTSAKKEYKK